MANTILETDGLITDKENITLVTTNADCILLLFFDPVTKTIANTRSQLEELSSAYNNGTVPTMDEAKLLLISKFAKDFRFNMEASTFNDEKLGFGDYEEITSWQAIKETGKDAFDFEILELCSIEELSEKEKYWTDKLQATKSGNIFDGNSFGKQRRAK